MTDVNDTLRAAIVERLNGHTAHSRDCHLSGEYLADQVWPLITEALAIRAATIPPDVERLREIAKSVAQFSKMISPTVPDGDGIEVVLSCGEIRRAAAAIDGGGQ